MGNKFSNSISESQRFLSEAVLRPNMNEGSAGKKYFIFFSL
jgi:hypothetical protein